jgi:hypothetical protein
VNAKKGFGGSVRFFSVTVGKLSFLIALWIVVAGVCFLSLHAPYFGLSESGGEPA